MRTSVPNGAIHQASAGKRDAFVWRPLPPSIPSYVQGGCGDERTQELNSSAFQRWGLLPRMMVDCSQRDLSIDLFGMKLPTPLFMSPIGVIGLCA
jgi:lactate 2-monooxygenase